MLKIKNHAFIISILFFISSITLCQETKVTLYVSPSGSDANSGTIDKPFLSLECARDKIRQIKQSSQMPKEGITVFLRNGEYFLEKTFNLNSEDSGDDGAPIIYTAFPGEKPVLIGGKIIKDWKKLKENIKGLKPGLKGKIYVASIEKGWHFHFMYVNGKPQRLSRSSNSDVWSEWPKPISVGKVGTDGQMLKFIDGQLNDLEGMDGQIEINLMPVNYWNTISVLRGIDARNSVAYRHSKNPTTFWIDSFQEGNYNLLNSIKFIDEPGEYAVNSNDGKVYLLPDKKTIAPDDIIIAPVLYRLIHIKGDEKNNKLVKNVQFQGIEFRYTDRLPEDVWPEEWIKRQSELPDAMLYIEDAENLSIKDCKFFNSGGYCIDLEKYSQNIKIIHNEMGFMGCGGVLLQGYGPGLKDVNKNNTISNNYFYQGGFAGYMHPAAITLFQSGSNDICYNIINHTPYVGIQICGASWASFGREEPTQCLDAQDPGGVDSYGKAKAQFFTRWEDFPNGHKSMFSRESFKGYLHSANNRINHNILLDYMEKMSDGAPIYSYSTGMGNLFHKNLMKRRKIEIPGQKWLFALYLDDNVDGAVMSDNRVWGQVFTAESTPGYRVVVGDKVWGQPYQDNIFYNKGQNMWSDNVQGFPDKPEGFDELLREIVLNGLKNGGWPGNLPEEVLSVIKK